MRNHTGWLSLFSLLVLALSVLSAGIICHATPSPSPWEEILTKHKWDAIPDNWVSLGQPPNGTTIKLHIALKANRENALVDALHEVSHPRHPKYGEHLSKEQTAELVAPHPDTLELVFSWLKYNGVPPSSISQTHGGSWLTIVGVPIFQANKLLGASYELYYHAWANETILRTVSYALPTALHELVQTIVPTTAFTSTRLLQQTRLSHSSREAANVTSGEPSDVLSGRNLDHDVTPSFLRWLYEMPFDDPDPTDRNKLGIAGLANQLPNQGDLYRFISEYRSDVNPRIATRIIKVIPVNGGVDFQDTQCLRANIDTQFSVALTFPTQIEYYIVGGILQPLNGPPMDGDQYLEWLQYMINLENVPQTVSVPYASRELNLPPEYVYSLCDLFQALGARGVSVLVASGDQGVGPLITRPYRDSRFSTTFPASCPYVTSVGGTKGNVRDSEEGSDTSGGGFSYYFPRPDYQQEAVPPFVQQLGYLYAGHYNPVGRGVPDIAMASMEYPVFGEGGENRDLYTNPAIKSSTSFSTNTAAAIITLLNDFRIKNNKHPLGFLNYWLYEAGLYLDGLNDVTGGHNPGCGTDGFFATKGWDPITGLGTLNYTLLAQNLKWSGMK